MGGDDRIGFTRPSGPKPAMRRARERESERGLDRRGSDRVPHYRVRMERIQGSIGRRRAAEVGSNLPLSRALPRGSFLRGVGELVFA